MCKRLNVFTYAYREKTTNSLRYQTNWLWCAAIALHAVLMPKLTKSGPRGGRSDVANDHGRSSKPEYLRNMPVLTSAKASSGVPPPLLLLLVWR